MLHRFWFNFYVCVSVCVCLWLIPSPPPPPISTTTKSLFIRSTTERNRNSQLLIRFDNLILLFNHVLLAKEKKKIIGKNSDEIASLHHRYRWNCRCCWYCCCCCRRFTHLSRHWTWTSVKVYMRRTTWKLFAHCLR